MIVKCPRCGKETAYDKENPARPFCSERCKLLDLGQWASENYRVPVSGDAVPDDERSSSQGQEPPKS